METAGSPVKVDGVGVVFARARAPDNDQSIIIRAPAKLITSFKSGHLVPLSRVARCEGCWVAFQGNGESTTATIRVKDTSGDRIQLRVIERDGLFSLELEPLSAVDAKKYMHEVVFFQL